MGIYFNTKVKDRSSKRPPTLKQRQMAEMRKEIRARGRIKDDMTREQAAKAEAERVKLELDTQAATELVTTKAWLDKYFTPAGIVRPELRPEPVVEVLTCETCGKEFPGKLSLSGHKGRVHSQRVDPRKAKHERQV